MESPGDKLLRDLAYDKVRAANERSSLRITRAALEMLADIYPVRTSHPEIFAEAKKATVAAAEADWGEHTSVQFFEAVVKIENLDGRHFAYDLATRTVLEDAA